MDDIEDCIIWLACAGVAIILVALLSTSQATGPDCPGMDPEWLGFCQEEGAPQ